MPACSPFVFKLVLWVGKGFYYALSQTLSLVFITGLLFASLLALM